MTEKTKNNLEVEETKTQQSKSKPKSESVKNEKKSEQKTAQDTPKEQTKAELEKLVKEQQSEIKNLKDINLKLKDANMDVLVEMENLRKRTEREIDKISNFGNESLVKDLLPLIDSLELGKAQQNASSDDLKIGIQMSYDMLIKVLEKNKVSLINPEINSPLDPDLHEAITIVPNQELKHNHILDVMQKGVMLNGRVVRSAKVIVVDNPENADQSSEK